mmetsp:Transcript_11503/g.15143  ORF Transcript_11503/g.15143 Transcript_11503/m.15143 type:complete len:108 (-) Transcript_11503:262-585(-)
MVHKLAINPMFGMASFRAARIVCMAKSKDIIFRDINQAAQTETDLDTPKAGTVHQHSMILIIMSSLSSLTIDIDIVPSSLSLSSADINQHGVIHDFQNLHQFFTQKR